MTDEKLKILHLTTHLNTGGITTYILEAGSEFLKMGHEVWVVSSGGDIVGQLEQKGLRHLTLPIRTKNSLSLKVLFAVPRVAKLVRTERIDLLHAHTRVTQVLASLVSFWTKTPFISTAHGFYRRRLGRRLFPAWGKRIIAVGPLVAEELEKTHKVPRSKVRVIFNAIDVEAHKRRVLQNNPSEIRRGLGIDDGAFVMGSVSRLVHDKGHAYLLEAAARLRKRNENVHVLIVGDGREKPKLSALIQKLNLSDRAHLVDSNPDVSGLLSAMDVFVHPATFREGFGLAMLEAMVAKIPVIATDIWAINSIIRNRVNGYLVAPKNAAQIEETVLEIMRRPEVAGSVAENAYQMAARAYSIDRMAGEMETVYEEVLSEHGAWGMERGA